MMSCPAVSGCMAPSVLVRFLRTVPSYHLSEFYAKSYNEYHDILFGHFTEDRMEIRTLRYFLAVAREENMTRAAEQLQAGFAS